MKFPVLLPIFLVFYEFILNLSNDAYISSLLVVGKDINVPDEFMEYTIAIWLAGAASFQLILGPLSDRFGRKNMLSLCGVIFLIATAMCGNTNSFVIFIFGRFLQGVSLCCFMVSGYSVVPEVYHAKIAVGVFTWMTAITLLSPMIGPLLGALVMKYFSWRAIFHYLFILGVVFLIPLLFFMPKRNIEEERKLKFLKLQKIYTGFLKTPAFLYPTFCYSLIYSALVAWITTSPFIIMDIFKQSPISFGIIQFIVFGGYAVGALIVRPFIASFFPEAVLHFGLYFALISSFSFLLYSIYFATNITVLVILMALVAFGCSLSFTSLKTRILLVSGGRKGSGLAVYSFFNMGIGCIVSFIISYLPDNVIYLSGMILFLMLSAVYFSYKK